MHDFGEGFGVGWGWRDRGGCGFGDGGDFAEVVRGEDAGVTIASVREVAECRLSKRRTVPSGISRDAERVAGADFDFTSFERVGDDAVDAYSDRWSPRRRRDCGRWHLRSGGDVELEDGDGGCRVLPSAGIRPGRESPTAPYLFISSSLRVCPLSLSP